MRGGEENQETHLKTEVIVVEVPVIADLTVQEFSVLKGQGQEG